MLPFFIPSQNLFPKTFTQTPAFLSCFYLYYGPVFAAIIVVFISHFPGAVAKQSLGKGTYIITTQGFGSTEDKDWHISRLNMDLMNQSFLVSLDLE